MDAITYFLFHSFVLHLILAAAFFLIGWGMGWWQWSRWQRRARELEVMHARAEERLRMLAAEGEPRRSREAALAARLAEAETALVEARRAPEVAIQELRPELAAYGDEVEGLRAAGAKTTADLVEARSELRAVRARLAEVEGERDVLRRALDR